MRRLFTKIGWLVDRCSLAGAVLGAFSLFLMIWLITVDVIGRKFGHSTGVAFEITGYLLLIAVFLGMAYTMKLGKHIEITLVTSMISQRVRRWLRIATSVVGLAFIGWLFWFTLQNAIFSYTFKSVTRTALRTPMWLSDSLVPIGLALLALVIIVQTIKLIKHNQE